MGKLSSEERPIIGQLANEIRSHIEQQVACREEALKREEQSKALAAEKLDVTMPGKSSPMGKEHPLSTVLDELKEIFFGDGLQHRRGPEVETDYYNFEALNLPRTTPPGTPRTPFTFLKISFSAPRPPAYRFM